MSENIGEDRFLENNVDDEVRQSTGNEIEGDDDLEGNGHDGSDKLPGKTEAEGNEHDAGDDVERFFLHSRILARAHT